jgi:hypothetical protein
MKKNVRKGRRVASPQVFDPEDFDVHEAEESFAEKIWPQSKKEKLADLKMDIGFFKGKEKLVEKKESKSILVSIIANVIIPGLGNVYVKRSVFSIAVLVFSLVVMLATFSPVFPIVQLLGSAQPMALSPYATADTVLLTQQNILINNQLLVGPTFSILVVPIFLAWIHLLYLFIEKSSTIKWRA